MTPADLVTLDAHAARCRIVPPHEVRDVAKLAALEADMRVRGWCGRPLAAVYDGNAYHALTGSHRYAAAVAAGVAVPVLYLDCREHVHDADEDEDCAVCRLLSADDDESRAAIAGEGEIDADIAALIAAEIAAAQVSL